MTASKCLPAILIGSGLLLVPSVQAATAILNPIADTYIDFVDNPLGTQGSETSFTVARFSIFSDALALLQFDLSGIPTGSTVNSATLTLSASGAASDTDDLVVYSVTSSWLESTASGDFPPDIDFITVDSYTASPSVNDPVFDVTSLVTNWVDGSLANDGLAIDNEFSPNFSATYDTREGANPPVLTINYTPIPEPGSIALLALASGLLGFRRRPQIR